MDNLKHLYFFKEEENGIIRSRYTIGQILFDLVTVPEQVREACNVSRTAGLNNIYKPTFYVLKYISIVHREIPNSNPDDLIYLCGKIGSFLSQKNNKFPVVSINIEKIKTDKIPSIKKTTRYYAEHIIENTKTNNSFLVSVCKIPDYDQEEELVI